MPRLFTAIELPEMARTHLSLVRGEISGARWMAAENLHLTLRFYGDVDHDTAGELIAHLEAVTAEPVVVEIAGTGMFGGNGEAAVYAGVRTTPELAALQRTHERIARLVGLSPSAQPFKPHVTIARVRNPRPTQMSRFLAETGALRVTPYVARQFVLLASRPGRGGGPYALETAVRLGDTSP